jgi:serine/threonine-protein kinase
MVAVIAIASGALQLQSRRASSPSPTITRLDLTLPFGVELSSTNSPNVAISPHGERIAFIGALSGSRQLYVRHLGDFDSVPMRGTGIPNICFFSPDGNSLGFITTDRVLKKMALADGLVTPLVSDADYTAGAVWGVDSGITFGRAGNLWRVPAAGGSATQLTTLDSGNGERLHAWPALVEPGKAILFASVTGSSRGATHIEAFSLATGQRHVVMESASFPLYASSGHLIFFRDGALLAAPFDASRLQVAGPAVRVVDNVAVDVTGVPLVTLSDAGTLAYIANDRATRRLVWVSRQGVEQPITETARPYQNPRLAPDGRRIVVEVTGDLWIQDVTRATFTRLTLGDTVGNSFAVWTPDASRIFFRALTGLQGIDADGSGHSQVIAGTSVTDVPTSVSPDGKTLAFIRQRTTNSNADIYVLSLLGEPKPRPVVTTPGYDGGAEFSPDGQWMAYVSNESGRNEVYVRPYPGPDRKVQVSIEGGTHLKWNRSGKELFYRVGNKMMVVDVSTRPDLTLSQPRVLFEQRYAFGSAQTMANYDVSRDGQRFVMVKDDSASGRLSIVLNWFDELKRRVPPK